LFGVLESDGGRTSTPQLPTPPPGRHERAAVRTFSSPHNWPGMREHAGPRRESSRAARGPRRDKVRAPNDLRLHTAIMPHIFFGEMSMTAYLISLALIGLVVIAVSEEFS
jgi:hypothetical protein